MHRLIALFAACSAAACAVNPAASPASPQPLATAEAFIDAFYSFDPQRLRAAMAYAPASLPRTLYYQGWAEGGHSTVLDRKACVIEKDDAIACSITVKDDLISALGTGYDVTDTFHLTFEDGRITAVRNSSNDPPEFEQAQKWVETAHPEILAGPCRDAFGEGKTPQQCVRAVVKAFAEFAALRS